MGAKVKKLSELNPGDIFAFAGIKWVKLEDLAEGTKVIAADKVEDIAFDESENNNWKESTLREYLNNDFLEYLYDEGATEEDFLSIVSDLTADDGLKNYGTSEDKIALITCDDYRKYRSLIPMIDWWWTITPWSCNPPILYNVCNVYYSGALSYSHVYNSRCGVRPLCVLKSDIPLPVTDEEKEEEQGEESLFEKIKKWAIDRSLHEADPCQQMLKLTEEAGELAEGIAKNKPEQIKDSIGDVIVVLTVLSLQLGLDVEECMKATYNEIKDRKGKIINGVFVKEEDLKNR